MKPSRDSNAEGALPPPNDRVGGWTKGVGLTQSVSGGRGSASRYPQKANGTNKRPGVDEGGTETRQEFWPKGRRYYTGPHGG